MTGHIICMDSNYMLRIQNSLQHSSHHPSFPITYSSVSQNNKYVASHECQNNIRDARLLACDVDEEMSVIEEKVITGMCFGFLTNVFTQLTVHACDMITHLKLR